METSKSILKQNKKIFLKIQNNRENESDTKQKSFIPESCSDVLYNSIVRIEIKEEKIIGTGFFLKIKNMIYLITCSHIIFQAIIDRKEIINIYYGKKDEQIKKEIALDKSKRYIKIFKHPLDVTLIGIIESDNIPKGKFLYPDYNYKNGYHLYKPKFFCLAGYPNNGIIYGQRCLSSGKITKIDNFEFEHSLDTTFGSSGSPICLIENNYVIAIHKSGNKSENINYGTFIGIIIDELEGNIEVDLNNDLTNLEIINYFNPYEILGLEKFTLISINEEETIRNKFYQHYKKEPFNKKLLMSYFMILNENKFMKLENSIFFKKDHFYYLIMNDLYNLKRLYFNNKYILASKDNFCRSLLHLSVIYDYFEITKFLLDSGINVEDIDKFQCTPLAYSSDKIGELLEQYGAKCKIYQAKEINAINIEIKDINKIEIIYNNFLNEEIVRSMDIIKKGKNIIGKRFIRNFSKQLNKDEMVDWIPVYHGTKFVSMKYILLFGLRDIGEPLNNHIPLGKEVYGINNWSNAIFVTPSIFYASQYSEIIRSENEEWYIIIEAKIKPDCFSKFESTIYNYKYKNFEPKNIEYRIPVEEKENYCYGDENFIQTNSILFVKKQYLDSLNNYDEQKVFEYD